MVCRKVFAAPSHEVGGLQSVLRGHDDGLVRVHDVQPHVGIPEEQLLAHRHDPRHFPEHLLRTTSPGVSKHTFLTFLSLETTFLYQFANLVSRL